MELRTLRAFVEVVRRGGFSQAAKSLNATQSTVSKSVKQLEQELGETLLDRDTSRSRLTGAGEVVFRHASTIMAQRDDLIRELDELRWLKRGTLRLGIPAFSSGMLIAPIFAAYRKQFPGIEIVITEAGSARQEEMLATNELDLAALLFPGKAEFEWDEQDIVEIRFVALVSKEHQLSGRASVEANDLKDQPLLGLPEDAMASASVQRIWDSAGFAPQFVARSSQLHFLMTLAEQGVGIALVPETSFELKSAPAVSAIPIDHPGASWRLVFAWRKGGYLSHAARAWLALSRAKSANPREPDNRGGSSEN